MVKEIRIIDTPVAREAAMRYGMNGDRAFSSTWNTYVMYSRSICFCGTMLMVEFENGQNDGEFFFVKKYEGNTLYLAKYELSKVQL